MNIKKVQNGSWITSILWLQYKSNSKVVSIWPSLLYGNNIGVDTKV